MAYTEIPLATLLDLAQRLEGWTDEALATAASDAGFPADHCISLGRVKEIKLGLPVLPGEHFQITLACSLLSGGEAEVSAEGLSRCAQNRG